MQLSFLGAAKQVTGSMYLLELDDDYKILVDCGADFLRDPLTGRDNIPLYRGDSSIFPFEPTEINLVVLTHAHLDHTGFLPVLIKEGYEGQVLSTSPTADLTKILLADSARLNRKKYNTLIGGGKKAKKHTPAVLNKFMAPMFLEQQVEETMERFVTISFNHRFKIRKDVYLTFIPTGHLLGAGNLLFEIKDEEGNWIKVGFSGDIGRSNYPLLPNPDPFPEVDYLVCESTYGGRYHEDENDPIDTLAQVITETCVDMPGRLIIPAFSVGRTQSLLYTLNRLYTERNFKPIRVFADSPLALQSTRIYEKYTRLLNDKAKAFFEDNETLFDFESLQIIDNVKDSRELSNYREPSIIISSSGMISGGRVENHIKMNISNPYCTIFMIGYSAEGTLGNELMHRPKSIIIQDREFSVAANIRQTDVFSGHADQIGLMDFVKQQSPERLKKVFLVHGDFEAMQAFEEILHSQGYPQVAIPEKGATYIL